MNGRLAIAEAVRLVDDAFPSPSPEVRALLWEIARLRAIVRRADQLQECLPVMDATVSALGIALAALRRELAGEPCLEERRRAADAAAVSIPADPWAKKREARRRRNG